MRLGIGKLLLKQNFEDEFFLRTHNIDMKHYPIPDEVHQRITKLFKGIRISKENKEKLIYRFCTLLVRENRLLRKEILGLERLMNGFVEDYAESEEDVFRAETAGETASIIVNEIIYPAVYFNTEEREERARGVEDFITKFNQEENG